MNSVWLTVIAVIMVVAFFALKRLSFVPAEIARQQLTNGAPVIDVRSPEEFRSSHVPGAINIPLGQLRERIPALLRDKDQPLLLHCLSGGRSAIAQQQLKRMGYVKAFNLGSLARAKQIVNAARSH